MSTEFIKQLCKRKCDYKAVMRKAKADDVKAVCELSADVLRKKVPLGKKHIQLVMQNRRVLRHLVHPQYSINSKRRYLAQRGGGLGSLLSKAAKYVGRTLKPTMSYAMKPVEFGKHVAGLAKQPVRLTHVAQAAAARANTAARAAAAAAPKGNVHLTRLKAVGRALGKPYRIVKKYAARHNKYNQMKETGAMGDHTSSVSKMTALKDDYTGAGELAKEALTRGATPATSVTNLSNASSLSSMEAIRRYAAGGDSLASLASNASIFKKAGGGTLASSSAKFPSTVSLDRVGGFTTTPKAPSKFESMRTLADRLDDAPRPLADRLGTAPSTYSSTSDRFHSAESLLSRGKRSVAALDMPPPPPPLAAAKRGADGIPRHNFADVRARGPGLEAPHWERAAAANKDAAVAAARAHSQRLSEQFRDLKTSLANARRPDVPNMPPPARIPAPHSHQPTTAYQHPMQLQAMSMTWVMLQLSALAPPRAGRKPIWWRGNEGEYAEFVRQPNMAAKVKFIGKRAAYQAGKSLLAGAVVGGVSGGISGAISSTLNKRVYDEQSKKSKNVLDELDSMKKRLESSYLTQGTPYSAIPAAMSQAQTPAPSRSSSPPRKKKKATNKHVSFGYIKSIFHQPLVSNESSNSL